MGGGTLGGAFSPPPAGERGTVVAHLVQALDHAQVHLLEEVGLLHTHRLSALFVSLLAVGRARRGCERYWNRTQQAWTDGKKVFGHRTATTRHLALVGHHQFITLDTMTMTTRGRTCVWITGSTGTRIAIFKNRAVTRREKSTDKFVFSFFVFERLRAQAAAAGGSRAARARETKPRRSRRDGIDRSDRPVLSFRRAPEESNRPETHTYVARAITNHLGRSEVFLGDTPRAR